MAKKQSRHGLRADNKTQTSISLKTTLLERAKEEAEQDGRSFSNWLEQLLKERYPEVELEDDADQPPKSSKREEGES